MCALKTLCVILFARGKDLVDQCFVGKIKNLSFVEDARFGKEQVVTSSVLPFLYFERSKQFQASLSRCIFSQKQDVLAPSRILGPSF